MDTIKNFLFWILAILLIGGVVGSISAFFLVSLDFVTTTRENQFIWVLLLPLGGLLIGYTYYYLEKGVEGGNNHLIKEMIVPERKIHWKMTPLVLFGTLATHLFGGSAGREGTAVQMGGATADQLSLRWKSSENQRKTILRMGVAAGFASIFGTPMAGIAFAYELGRDKRFHIRGILPILLASFLGDFVCHAWQVEHTHYTIAEIPTFTLANLGWTLLAGLIFGGAAYLFSILKVFFTKQFQRLVKFPPFRPFIGGIVIVLVVLLINDTKYLGLGVPYIESSFTDGAASYDFIVKLLFTAFTLGAGYKGGEATPLFFIGATLGSVLIWFIPLPISLLAGLGFIAVFAGATNTPIACIIMGIELFGGEATPYYMIVCVLAFVISGNTSVYAEQQKILRKYSLIKRKNKLL